MGSFITAKMALRETIELLRVAIIIEALTDITHLITIFAIFFLLSFIFFGWRLQWNSWFEDRASIGNTLKIFRVLIFKLWIRLPWNLLLVSWLFSRLNHNRFKGLLNLFLRYRTLRTLTLSLFGYLFRVFFLKIANILVLKLFLVFH